MQHATIILVQTYLNEIINMSHQRRCATDNKLIHARYCVGSATNSKNARFTRPVVQHVKHRSTGRYHKKETTVWQKM